MKCLTPSKIKKEKPLTETLELIPDQYAKLLLDPISKVCFNSNFAEWFYKLCPFNNAQQVLSYKQLDDKGNEFTEIWNLGVKPNTTESEDIYIKETQDSTSYNLEKTDPFVIVEGRIGKIYNYDLSSLKTYETGLIINYNIEELSGLGSIKIDQYNHDLQSYLKNNPGATDIPVQRKIIKLVNKHLVLLDSQFPIPKIQQSVNLNLIKQKKGSEINHSFTLNIYEDYVYCFKCEFLTHYSIGDSLIIVIAIKLEKW
jgi:hypothetical protein